jgi:hypothetical protein
MAGGGSGQRDAGGSHEAMTARKVFGVGLWPSI